MDLRIKNRPVKIDNEILDRPMGISVYQTSSRNMTNPCWKRTCSGGVCIPSNQGFEAKCICPTGIRNGDSCALYPDNFVAMATKEGIRRISLDTPDRIPVSILPPDANRNIVALDFHFTKKLLFFTDNDNDEILQCDFDGKNLRRVHSVKGGATMA